MIEEKEDIIRRAKKFGLESSASNDMRDELKSIAFNLGMSDYDYMNNNDTIELMERLKNYELEHAGEEQEIPHYVNNSESNHNLPQNKDEKNMSDAAKLAAEGVATVYGGKLGGIAVKAFSKTNLGKKTFNTVGNVANNALKHPLGIINPNILAEASNLKEDMDVLNAKDSKKVDLPPDMPTDDNKDPWNNSKANNSIFDRLKNKDNSFLNIKNILKKKKILLYGIIGAALLLFIMFFVAVVSKDFSMLDLTGSIYKPTSKGGASGGSGSSIRQIEKSLLYVGDERILDMKEYIQSTTVKFIGHEKADYNWLSSTGRGQINNKISEDNQIKYVVINLGLYDLDNADKYINIMNSLISSNDKIKYLFMSIGPVREGQAPKEMTRERINTFNNKMKNRLGERYIDITEAVGTNFTSSDGIKYDGTTYRAIHSAVLSYIKSTFSQGFLDEYPDNTKAAPLKTPIKNAIGEQKYLELNQKIKDSVNNYGKCTKEAVAAAGVTLVNTLYEYGYYIVYYYGGWHANAKFDPSMPVTDAFGTTIGPDHYGRTIYGFDCSGFVSWAISTATGNMLNYTTESFYTTGNQISFDDVEPGDIITNNHGHILLIIGKKEDYIQVIEAVGDDGGDALKFNSYTAEGISSMIQSDPLVYKDINDFIGSRCSI